MAFTDPFIRRPVLATVVSLLIVLLGMQAFSRLVIREYPQMENALITVTTFYAGANAETIQGYITQPLQQSLASAEGIDYMTSVSRQNYSVISIYAHIGANTDRLVTELLSKIGEVKTQLPPDAEDPVLDKEAADASALMYISFYSEHMDNPQITDYLSRVIQPKLATLPGIAEAEILGNQVFAMRLWLDPVKMAAYGITASDIDDAVRKYNFLSAAGEVKGELVVTSVNAATDLKSPQAFAAIPLKTLGDRRVLMSDVARVELGAASYDSVSSFNGIPSVYIGIKGTPSSNPLDVIKEVRAKMPELEEQLPPDLKVSIAYDATRFIQASIDEVVKTLGEAILIVIVVVFLFLGAFRSVLIPVVTIPLSMIGVLFFMQLMGYSINLLTLLAMVLAIGLVVDDAIVVMENIQRHIENGVAPVRAALAGAGEVGFTLLAMNTALVVVFVSILFMGGLIERLFREFSITLAAAMLVSLGVSLTLTPALCARLLRGHGERPAGRLQAASERVYARVLRAYSRTLRWSLRHSLLVLALLAAVIALNVYLYVAIPKGFLPQQDTGQLQGFVRGDDGASYQVMQPKMETYRRLLLADPAVQDVIGTSGGDRGISNARMLVRLKPLAERGVSAQDVVARLRAAQPALPAGMLMLSVDQDINMPRSSGASSDYDLTLLSDDIALLRTWAPRVSDALAALPELVDVSPSGNEETQQVTLHIDREAARRLGVDMNTVTQVLNNSFSQRQVATLYSSLNQYRVVMEVEPRYTQDPRVLDQLQVITADGTRVPLSAFARYDYSLTNDRVHHDSQFAAVDVSFAVAEGVPLDTALQAVDRALAEVMLPTEVQARLGGTAGGLRSAIQAQPMVILGVLVAVYLVLGMLYESTLHPLTILSTLPSAGIGALLALRLTGTEFSLIALLGLFLLIGVVMKNAILMIDFALEAERRRGLKPLASIYRAARLRLRPILMTNLAALLGALPLVLSAGEGVEMRRPLGIAIVGGLAVSQLLTLYTTPVVYLYLDRLRAWTRRRKAAGEPADGFQEAR